MNKVAKMNQVYLAANLTGSFLTKERKKEILGNVVSIQLSNMINNLSSFEEGN